MLRYDAPMVRLLTLTLGLAVLGTGCASGHGGSSEAPGAGSKARSRELYAEGEARFSAGAPREAVALWRAALLELPEGPDFDRLRHKVILRMSHALLVAYERGDVDALLLAHQILERYVAWHKGRRSGAPGAEAEQKEARSLLVVAEDTIRHLESQAEASGEVAVASSVPDAPASSRWIEVDAPGERVALADAGSVVEVVDPRAASAPIEVEAAGDDAATEASDDEVASRPTLVLDGTPHRREIVVKPYGSDFHKLPGVQRFFKPGLVGASLFSGSPRWFFDGPRVLVRAGLTSVRGELAYEERRPAKTRARAAVASVRGRLARCYLEAVGRGLDEDIRLIVDLEVAADGALTVTSVQHNAQVFDHRSQRCVRDALQAAAPSAPPPRVDVKVVLPIAIFVQVPELVSGGDGFDYGMDKGIAGGSNAPH
ncbi:MAG: hypothetical protein R3B09_04660 [Nannocystaceae bacterium]